MCGQAMVSHTIITCNTDLLPTWSAHGIFIKINNKILPKEEEARSRLHIQDSKATAERNICY
jgi:hypothetical protein